MAGLEGNAFQTNNRKETETMKVKFLVPVGTLAAAIAADHP
jgi:hypothetical protein